MIVGSVLPPPTRTDHRDKQTVFATLSDRLTGIFSKLRSKGRLTDADIDTAAREIRMALLEADVALPVVSAFISTLRERARGAEVHEALNPAQQVIKIVHEELIAILGGETRRLRFAKHPPTVIMLAGLQGSGKTTLAGKLGLWLRNKGHQPLLVAADLQRPNAVQQLVVLGERAGVEVYAPEPGNGVGDPVQVAKDSVEYARRHARDIVIIDTAGRLGVDAEMMAQAAAIRDATDPDEVLFVIDAMVGQDAVATAEAFRDGVGISGVVLSKLDGDARGGAALSVRHVTGQPILFASNGEKLEDFDLFHPDRMAGRILGMGDQLTLIEKAEQAFADEQKERLAARVLGQGELTLEDFLEQLQAHPSDGTDRQHPGDGAGDGADAGPDRAGRRPGPGPGHRDHPLHDPGGARQPQDHQWFPAGPDRRRVRGVGHRGQPAADPVRGSAEAVQADGRHDGRNDGIPRRGPAEGHQVAQGKRKQKKGGRSRAGRASGGVPGGLPGGLPRGCRSCRPVWTRTRCRRGSSPRNSTLASWVSGASPATTELGESRKGRCPDSTATAIARCMCVGCCSLTTR